MQKFKSIDCYKFLAVIIAATFAVFCFENQYPAIFNACRCTDAYAYFTMGDIFSQHGIVITDWSRGRLYGYPFFVAGAYLLAHLNGFAILPVLATLQVVLYFALTSCIAYVLGTHFSKTYGNIVFYGLIGNAFIYPYLILPLSDGFSVLLLLMLILILLLNLISIHRSVILKKYSFYFLTLGCIAGFSVMVRPANLYFLPLAPLFACIVMINTEVRKVTYLLINASAFVSGFFLVTLPQIIFNEKNFHKLSFMPVVDLGHLQLSMGARMIKYATNMSGGKFGLIYHNPWTNGGQGLIWYLHHPLKGIATIFLHVFAAFDFDYFFCYIYNLTPNYRFALFLMCHSIVFWGIYGYCAALKKLMAAHDWRKNFSMRIAAQSFMVLYPTIFIGWLSIFAFSAIENRFSLPIVTLLLPLAFWSLFILNKTKAQKIKLTGVFVLYLLIAHHLSHFISSLMIAP